MRATASAAGLHYFFNFFLTVPYISAKWPPASPVARHHKCQQSFLAAGLYDLTDADEKPNPFEEPPGRILHVKRRIKKSQLNEEENECTKLYRSPISGIA